MTIIQCMGGWCGSRDLCAHYSMPQVLGREPVERLCGDVEEPEAWYRQRLVRVQPITQPQATGVE